VNAQTQLTKVNQFQWSNQNDHTKA